MIINSYESLSDSNDTERLECQGGNWHSISKEPNRKRYCLCSEKFFSLLPIATLDLLETWKVCLLTFTFRLAFNSFRAGLGFAQSKNQ